MGVVFIKNDPAKFSFFTFFYLTKELQKKSKKILFTNPSFDLLFHRPSSARKAALINLLSPN